MGHRPRGSPALTLPLRTLCAARATGAEADPGRSHALIVRIVLDSFRCEMELGMPGRSAKGARMFTIAEKQEFVREFNLCVEWGAKSELLRRWNLHPGVARRWVIAAQEGRLGPAASTGRLDMGTAERARLIALERENERLRAKVASAEAALEIMGKAHELLDGTLRSSHEDDEVPLSLMSVAEYQQWLERYKTS